MINLHCIQMLVDNLILRANKQFGTKTQKRVILAYENKKYLELQLIKCHHHIYVSIFRNVSLPLHTRNRNVHYCYAAPYTSSQLSASRYDLGLRESEQFIRDTGTIIYLEIQPNVLITTVFPRFIIVTVPKQFTVIPITDSCGIRYFSHFMITAYQSLH